MPPLSTTTNSLPATLFSFVATQSPSTQMVPGDITCEAALRAILKKKVKGNEKSMWSEMWVLQGLDHPHVVCPPHTAVTL